MTPRFLLLLAMLPPAAAGAQTIACDGQVATIRTSTVLPGKMALFQKAVADQSAWYAAHPGGSSARLMRVIRYDATAKRQAMRTMRR